jgi:hypothetical protein
MCRASQLDWEVAKGRVLELELEEKRQTHNSKGRGRRRVKEG